MRERAEAVKAILSVISQPGQGTEVSIQWSPPQKRNPYEIN
jgi:signal transduction histidine kinase